MSENNNAREKRRHIILKGISQDLKHSIISKQLGVNQRVLTRDIKVMQLNSDHGLKQAEKEKEQARKKKVLLLKKEKKHFKENKRFQGMTGITLQEKSFRNMIDFNKRALLKILRSKDQQAAIVKLPTNLQKTLRKHGIITENWHKNEITMRAEEYLTIKNPDNEP
jgi:hypothetical protein